MVVNDPGHGERFARLKVPQTFPRLLRIPDEDRAEAYERLGLEKSSAPNFVWPEEVVAAVKESGLRGRGGAGFPTGVKWGFMPKGSDKTAYLICNADEAEPGTFKEHLLINEDVFLLLEGMIMGCYAIACVTGII